MASPEGSQGQTHEPWIDKIVETFASWLNIISAFWLASIALLILCDVVGREVFSAPLKGTNEIVSNSVLSILFLQLPLSILSRNSLRTTIFYGGRSARGKSLIDIASYFLAALLFVSIMFGGWSNMIESWEIFEQEGSGIVTIPVYPIRTLVVFIGGVGAIVCLLLIFQSWTRPTEFEEA